MDPMGRFVGPVVAMLMVGLGACTSDPEVASEEDPAPVLPILFDDQSAVVIPGTDLGDGRTLEDAFTPSDEAVAAVLATIDSDPDLVWGAGHVRFVSGSRSTGDEVLRAYLSCSAERLLSPEQALEEFHLILNIDGGGDCYGWVTFTADGELIDWRTNGES